jgi:hypothetical protein
MSSTTQDKIYTFVLDFHDIVSVVGALYTDKKSMLRSYKKAIDLDYERHSIKEKIERTDKLMTMFSKALE